MAAAWDGGTEQSWYTQSMYWYQKIAVFDKEGFCFSMLKLKELSGVVKSDKIKCFHLRFCAHLTRLPAAKYVLV